MNVMADFYALLGVDRDADDAALLRGWRRAKVALPARRWQRLVAWFVGRTEERIDLAYATLRDPHRRAIYDAELERREYAAGVPPGH